jgi:hypothetical protein
LIEEENVMPNKHESLFPGDAYSWKLTGKGNTCIGNKGEPNNVIGAWDLEFMDVDEDGAEVLLGKLSFSVVNQGTACNCGVDLAEVYDAEDDFHFDYYEHALETDRFGSDILLLASQVVLIEGDVIAAVDPKHRLDALLIVDQVFSGAVVAVCCDDESSEVATQLASVMTKMPGLSGDDPKQAWFYHDDQSRWVVAKKDEGCRSSTP